MRRPTQQERPHPGDESPRAVGRLRRGAGWLWLPVGVALACVAVVYPFLADHWIDTYGVRAVAMPLAAIGTLALFAPRNNRLAPPWLVRAAFLLPIAGAVLTEERRFLMIVPALVQAWAGWLLLDSTRAEMSLFEQGARLMQRNAPGFIAPYCRKASTLLGAMLAANAVLVAVLALAAPLGWWQLWVNGLSWAVLALFFVGEYVVRKWWFRYYTPSPIDRVWAALFPAEATWAGRRSARFAEQMEARGEPAPSVLPWRRR